MINKYWLWFGLIICIAIVFLWAPYKESIQENTMTSESVVIPSTK